MRTKNVINLLLAGALTVGFAACNNDDVPNEKAGVTAVQFRVSEAQTRAVTDGQVDAEGVGAESEVKDGLFLTLGTDQIVTGKTPVALTPETGVNENTWTSKVVKYTGATGAQKATLILNAPASMSNQITDADQTISIDDLGELTATTGFTMSGTTTETENDINIKPGLSETDVDGGTDETKNNFTFKVERVVSKVQFSMPAKSVKLDGDFKLLAGTEFTNIRYAVAGSADKIYLFKNHAGTRTLDVATQMYTNFESAIHSNTAAGTTPRTGVTKVSDKKLFAHYGSVTADGTTWGTLNSLSLVQGTNYDTESQAAGIFFLENSLNKTITGKGQLNYNDITYVKVYATFAPPEVLKWNDGTSTFDKVTATAANNTYGVSVSNAWHDAHPSLTYTGTAGSWELQITDKAGTFYRGANGKLYYDLKSARKDKNPTSMKYVGGKMVWMTPANNQIDNSGDFTKYADTRRNNIYSLSLTSIDGFGKNYDPIDPTDPNIEEPEDNPDEPDVDPIIPVDPTETHIRVKATILKWNLVHRGVVLK